MCRLYLGLDDMLFSIYILHRETPEDDAGHERPLTVSGNTLEHDPGWCVGRQIGQRNLCETIYVGQSVRCATGARPDRG